MNSISILGCGWLGLPLAIALRKKGWEVKGSTTSANKLDLLEKEGIQPFLINIYQPETWAPAFFKSDILFINIPPGRRNPKVLEEFPAAMKLFLSHIPPDAKVMIVSSTSVYGEAKGMVSEKTDKRPSTLSGQALDRVEQCYIEALAERVTILRPAGLVGAERHPIRQLSGRKELANGEAPVNLIHREDVLQVIQAIFTQQVWGEDFNLSADAHPEKQEYYRWAAEQLDLEVPTFVGGGADGKWINNEKVKSQLGIQLSYPDPKDFL